MAASSPDASRVITTGEPIVKPEAPAMAELYIAVHAYKKESDSEVSLAIGDVITVTAKKPSGWWIGVVDGRRGYFPSNHVREYKGPAATPPPRASTAQIGEMGEMCGPADSPHARSEPVVVTQSGRDVALILERMRGKNGVEVKNRRYRLRLYKDCFLGCEAVDWLVKSENVTREEAIKIGLEMEKLGGLRHVTNGHPFEDFAYFYNFTTTEDEYRRLYGILSLMRDKLGGVDVRTRSYRSSSYPDCFIGSEAVDWMMLNLPLRNRDDCVVLGTKLLNNNFIQHVTSAQPFKDDFLFYNFVAKVTPPPDRCDLSGFDNLRRFQKGDVTKDDFDLVKVLGQGGFGKVLLVKHKIDDKVYAMKVIPKDTIRSVDQIAYLRAERNILSNDFPFVVHLYYSFQSEDNLYLVMDFLQGGDLFSHIYELGRMPESEVAFVAAEIVLALRYLHENGIIWRDLKPENVLYDKDGHICITDFGISKEVGEKGEALRTTTVTGTPQYLAPEVLTADYDASVDYWALGVVIYQMLVGRNPFDRCQDDAEVLQRLASGQRFQMPVFLSDEAVDVINAFCDPNPRTRLGAGAKAFENIQGHVFFKGINWDELRVKKTTPPWRPVLREDLDTSNFPAEFTSMEATDSAGRKVAVNEAVSANLEKLADEFAFVDNKRTLLS